MSRTSQAEIDYMSEQNDEGYDVDCVTARCLISGDETEIIWGQHSGSIERALATLTEQCSCGAAFHVVARGDA